MDRFRAWARDELPLTLELTALTGFVIARPVLASFGDAPDVLIAEEAEPADIVVFALVVVLAPAAAALLAGSLVRAFRPSLRDLAQWLAVAGLGALATWQLADMVAALPLVGLASAGLVGGLLAALVRARVPSVATFLRFAALAAPVFLVQFVFTSRSAALIWDTVPADASPVTEVPPPGERVPSVVVVVLDELPTATLLDGDGAIDDALYPNIARLAADGSWYRNHTTVAGETPEAMTAIVTGRYPDPAAAPLAASHPDNIFTLLAGSHDVSAHEQLTALCPPSSCPARGGSSLPALVSDAAGLWGRYMARGGSPGIPTRSEDRLAEMSAWIDDQDFSPSGEPSLHFLHTVLPHVAWEYLPDGTRYQGGDRPTGVEPDQSWTERGTVVGRQRHVLQTQAVDREIGRLLDRLEAAGAYDDTLVVLTADHGAAFTPEQPRRGATPATFDQIAWTPLVVKAPGQAAGRPGAAAGGIVSDDNVTNLDILPTVLHQVGVEPEGLDLDGRLLGEDGDRDPDEKWLVDFPSSTLGPVDDRGLVGLDAAEGLRRVRAADPLPGTGPDAPWELAPDADLVGRRLDEVTIVDDDDGDGDAVSAQVDDRYDDLDMDAPLPLEIDVRADVAEGSSLVVAVNGVISGSTVAEPAGGGRSSVHMVVRPDALTPGDNDIRVFVVDTAGGDVVLRAV